MADEEKNETSDEAPDDATPEAAEEVPAEAPAEEPAAEPEKAPDDAPEEPPAEEPPAEDAPAEEPPAGEPATADAPPTEEAAPETDAPSPKEKRKLERSRADGPALPQRGSDERSAERAETRKREAAARRRYRERSRARRGEPGQGTAPADRPPGPKKVRLGKVVSTKADKTITVKIEVARRHPTYEKVVRRSATLHAHDASNAAGEGDTVRIVETRPLSKTKRWRLLEIVEKAR